MQLTNSVCIVDFFPEAFIAEACDVHGIKTCVKRFVKRVTFPSDYGKDMVSWSTITALTFSHEVNSRIASGADVTAFHTDKCPDRYSGFSCVCWEAPRSDYNAPLTYYCYEHPFYGTDR